MKSSDAAVPSTDSNIPSGWGWDDSTVYKWVIQLSRRSRFEFAFTTIGIFTLFPACAFGALWLVSRVSERAAMWIAIGAGLLLQAVLVNTFVRSWRGARRERAEARQNFEATAVLLVGIVLYLLHAPPPWLRGGFESEHGASLWRWILYVLDNAAAALFLDVPEILDIGASGIHPHALAARCLAAFLRVLMILGIVETAVSLYEEARGELVVLGTLRDCYDRCVGLWDKGGEMVIRREGRLLPIQETSQATVPDLLRAFRAQAETSRTLPKGRGH